MKKFRVITNPHTLFLARQCLSGLLKLNHVIVLNHKQEVRRAIDQAEREEDFP